MYLNPTRTRFPVPQHTLIGAVAMRADTRRVTYIGPLQLGVRSGNALKSAYARAMWGIQSSVGATGFDVRATIALSRRG